MAESWDFCLPISVSEYLCSLKSYFFLWYHSFSCRSGIAIFPGGYQIWFINLCESMKLTQSPLREASRGLWARPHDLRWSTVLWSCDTCPLVSHVTVTSNKNWPTSCTVWQTALLCRSVCGVLSKGMTSRSDSGKCLLRIKYMQSQRGLEYWGDAIQTLDVLYSK